MGWRGVPKNFATILSYDVFDRGIKSVCRYALEHAYGSAITH
jgi:hypothetical protein